MAIPIWKKLSLSTEEAAIYTNINVALIRVLVNLAMLGRCDFPYFCVGKSIKIPRIALEQWIENLNSIHPRLNLSELQKELVEARADVKRTGRKRKMILRV